MYRIIIHFHYLPHPYHNHCREHPDKTPPRPPPCFFIGGQSLSAGGLCQLVRMDKLMLKPALSTLMRAQSDGMDYKLMLKPGGKLMFNLRPALK